MIPKLMTYPPFFSEAYHYPDYDWDAVMNWFKTMDDAVKENFNTIFKGIPHATAITIKSCKEDMAVLSYKLYYQENGQYIEEVRACFIPKNALPAWAKDKLTSEEEVDITEEMAQELNIEF